MANFNSIVSSSNGVQWSKPRALAANGKTCGIGSTTNGIGLTWYDYKTNALMLRTSKDGRSWDKPKMLADAGTLLQSYSTTVAVLTAPYALVVPGKDGMLQPIWQVRLANQSKVYVGHSEPSVTPQIGFPLGGLSSETFLIGGGNCSRAVGAYKVTNASTGFFEYAVWSTDSTLQAEPLFQSKVALNPAFGDVDPRISGYVRIGDYTAVDCVHDKATGSTDYAWAAWTDTRRCIAHPSFCTHNPSRQNEIWATRLPLKP